MHSKNHRQNHNFQILYFLAGSCHTPDGAYALLCDLKEERQMAINNYHVSQKRTEARKLRAKSYLQSSDPLTKLEAEADLMEIESGDELGKVLYDAAVAESDFIDACIARIEPLRKFKHLSDADAHEACQQDEWLYELMERAENYLIMHGHIPADHFATMRQHPGFADRILPHIDKVQNLIQGNDAKQIASQLTPDKLFMKPLLQLTEKAEAAYGNS